MPKFKKVTVKLIDDDGKAAIHEFDMPVVDEDMLAKQRAGVEAKVRASLREAAENAAPGKSLEAIRDRAESLVRILDQLAEED